MEKQSKLISTYDDLPLESKIRFVGWIDPNSGGFRFKRDEQRSKTWHFGCKLVAWQANHGPVVREEIFIRKQRLNDSFAMSLIRQTPKGRIIEFEGSRPADTKSLQKSIWYVRIDGPIEKPHNLHALTDEARREASKPSVFEDSVFGTLKFDQEREHFEADTSFRGSKMYVTFETDSIDELKELIKHAKPLWKKRQSWFSIWRKACFEYYVQELKEAWYEGEEPLNEDSFNAKLGHPAGIDFSWNEGKLRYMITGMDDDLVGDHALEAHGTDLTPDEICLS